MNKVRLLLLLVLLAGCKVRQPVSPRFLHIGYLCDTEDYASYGTMDIQWRSPEFPQEDSLARYIQCLRGIRGTVLILGIYSFRDKTEFLQFAGKNNLDELTEQSLDSLSINCDNDTP
jgi:hypothetical protein